MEIYYKYDTATGAIINERGFPPGQLPPDAAVTLPAGVGYVRKPTAGSAQSQYIDTATGEVLDRPEMLVTVDADTADADGVDEVIISGIPLDTLVSAAVPEGVVAELVNDGVVEIASDLAGEGTVTLEHPLYMAKEITVTFV